MTTDLRIAFAGDRDISVWVLDFLLQERVKPLALLVSDSKNASHADKLIKMCSFLDTQYVLVGSEFRLQQGIDTLQSLNLDLIISIHFPYIIPKSVLKTPRLGCINLHPAFLPYNRGWHTPSWALLENTPIGATLHFMDEGVDTGDIIHQEQLYPQPDDTAHSLYNRLKILELEVFKSAWPLIASGAYKRQPQDVLAGTKHNRQDLFAESIQHINLDAPTTGRQLFRRLRALTTNNIEEAAYFEVDGNRYHIQVIIHKVAGNGR